VSSHHITTNLSSLYLSGSYFLNKNVAVEENGAEVPFSSAGARLPFILRW
jgi:hypothetical protein